MPNFSNRPSLITPIIPLSLFLCGMLLFAGQPAPAQEVLHRAPLNPKFTNYKKLAAQGVQKATAAGHALGLVPAPIDLSRVAMLPAILTSPPAAAGVLSLPASYDLRATGKLSAVRDQKTCGACWAFAANASLESNLLPAELWDFSENNLKNTVGYDLGECDGGNEFMAMAYLSRWSGPVSETDDPYNPSSSTSPAGVKAGKHVQEVIILPDRTGPTDNDSLKQAIMTYGAIYTSMYVDEAAYYKSTTYAYYYDGTGALDSNHAVAIVGWDDNFSSLNFKTPPPGNGAFLIRNSWGTAWGQSGYFYISYYDANVGTSNTVFNDSQPTTNFSKVYEYDPLGWTMSYGFGSTTGWFANVFTATATENLSAVSFYTPSPNSTYTVKVYTNVSSGPASGILAGSISGTIPWGGYHTIMLSAPVSLTAGQKFSAVVSLTTPGYDYPMPIEYGVLGYSSPTANAGESYLSADGTTWDDLTGVDPSTTEANVCLKAFTAANAVPPTVTTTIPKGITTTTAQGGGNVTSSGGSAITARGVCRSGVYNPTTADTCTSNGTGTGVFTSSLTGLSANTVYHVRAYATNSLGTSYGADVTFTAGSRPAAPTGLVVQ